MVVFLEARGRRGLSPLQACEWALPAVPVTSGIDKNKQTNKQTKNRPLEPSNIHYGFHPPGNMPTLQLSLANAVGNAQTFDHCPFPGTYN